MLKIGNSRGILNFFLVLLFFSSIQIFGQEERQYQIRTVAFYNVENIFDTIDDPFTFDEDRTPTGKDVWTEEKYRHKLKNTAKVISEIGTDKAEIPPAILGVCEIENLKVLEDLVNQPILLSHNFDIVHYDSPDNRGVDVALLYQKNLFQVLESKSHRLLLYDRDQPSKRVYTRDQLVVSGLLEGEMLHIIVNHWPSRSGGEARSSYRREKAGELNRRIIDSIYRLDLNAKIITMGDFNDDPTNKSIKKKLGTKANKESLQANELYNPMENMLKKGMGTLAFRDGWNLFDQIIISSSFLAKDYSSYQFYRAGIFNPDYLLTPSGQFKGYPFRSYDYGGYTGGYSDHFPVYIYLIRESSSTSKN